MKYVAKYVGHERVLKRIVDKANAKVLKSCGAYVRKIARDFIRHKSDPNKHSAPLQSPFDHFGLKQSIIFASNENAAYIGPRHIRGGLSNVARLHEFGGNAIVKDMDMELWRGVKEGMVAPVTASNVRQKNAIIRHDQRRDPKTGRKIVWIRISSKRQAEHSTRLYHRLMKHNKTTRMVKYPPRPYMAPALMKALPNLSKMWKNSIKA